MENLRQLRILKGYRASFVAKNLGITLRQLQRIETGQGKLSKKRAFKLSMLSQLYKIDINNIKKIYKRSALAWEKRKLVN